MNYNNKILRSPEEDPLSMPAGGIAAPEFPLLSEGLYDLVIDKVESGQNNDGTGERLRIVLKTTKEATSAGDHKPLADGFPVYSYLVTTPTEKTSVKDIAANLGVLLRCALGKDTKVTPRELLSNPSMIEGRVVLGKVTVRKASGDFPPSNNVRFVEPKQ